FTGYVNWMFWEKENNKLPFFVGSYIGAKKVFNIGAGFYSHANATGTLDWSGPDTARVYDFNQNNANLFAVDAYLDMPLGTKKNGLCLSVLATAYFYDFGQNYLRNVGILNLHSSTKGEEASFSGAGNAQPTIGTGTIGYVQAGLGLPRFKNGTQFMPYLTATYKDFERLNESSFQYDLGLNYFILGHNCKLTLQYSSRPVYDRVTRDRDGSKGEFILQTHIFL
ncbi:MAG: porin, partial [Saprospiraceae bacterium]|nr:porin [Saprospiraceae bacterium]